MSFSTEVKEDLIQTIPQQRHCRLSELSAILSFAGRMENGVIRVFPSQDNTVAIRKCFTLLSKTFNINTDIFSEDVDNNTSCIEFNRSTPKMAEVLDAIGTEAPLNILERDCCKRAYVRGAFLSGGFINDPKKAYHLEFVTDDISKAEMLKELLEDFDVASRIICRKKYHVLYIKEADAIQDVLNIMEAHKALMELVNARILKDVRNDTNRRVNCEIANSAKAVNAGQKQINAIVKISSTVGLESLPDTLREMAVIRLDHPELSLTELGELMDPPVGKSGVNHRLRKICEYAAQIPSDSESKHY